MSEVRLCFQELSGCFHFLFGNSGFLTSLLSLVAMETDVSPAEQPLLLEKKCQNGVSVVKDLLFLDRW